MNPERQALQVFFANQPDLKPIADQAKGLLEEVVKGNAEAASQIKEIVKSSELGQKLATPTQDLGWRTPLVLLRQEVQKNLQQYQQ